MVGNGHQTKCTQDLAKTTYKEKEEETNECMVF